MFDRIIVVDLLKFLTEDIDPGLNLLKRRLVKEHERRPLVELIIFLR